VSAPFSNQVPNIVAIDDDNELLKLIVMLLRRISAQVHTFSDGQSALIHLQNDIPDLVILDLMLPDISGLEILRTLRDSRRFDRVPILILSAKVDPDTIRQALDSGADSYVTKPYIANTLIGRVRLLLSQGRSNPPSSEA